MTPPTAATVIKVSHNSYTTSMREKREEVISFRNDLVRRYTYSHKRPSNEMGKSNFSKASAAIQANSDISSPLSPLKATRPSKKST